MKNFFNILRRCLYLIPIFLITNVTNVFAGDPWAALYGDGIVVYKADNILPKIYKLLMLLGAFGCVLTGVFYVVQIIFHPSAARGVNAGKEGLKYKLVIAFFIFTASFFMGLVFEFAYQLGGH